MHIRIRHFRFSDDSPFIQVSDTKYSRFHIVIHKQCLVSSISYCYVICISTASPFSINDRAFSNGITATSSCRKGPYFVILVPINCSIGLINLTTTCLERILAEIDSSTFGLPLRVAASTAILLLSDSFCPSKIYFSSSVSFEYSTPAFIVECNADSPACCCSKSLR